MSMLTRALFPVVRSGHDRRSRPATSYASAVVPPWVGTEADPAWLRVRAELGQFASMKDLRRSAQDCQIALADLSARAEEPGPLGEAAGRSLHGLALDIQRECQRLRRHRQQPVPRIGHPPAGAPAEPLWQWLLEPVGSGAPRSSDLARLRDIHRVTIVTRFIGAAAAAVLLASGRVWPALLCLLTALTASGVARYRTNAESVVTFRARYLSHLFGQAGDLLVLLGASVYLAGSGAPGLAVLTALTGAAYLLGTAARVGAMPVGVSVPRLRLERVVQVVGLTIGTAGAALGHPGWFFATLALGVAYAIWELHRSVHAVCSAGSTEFGWTAMTRDGFVTEVLTAPSPK